MLIFFLAPSIRILLQKKVMRGLNFVAKKIILREVTKILKNESKKDGK